MIKRSSGPALNAMNGCPISVNSTTFTEPAGPLGLPAGSAVTLSTFEFGSSDA